jgi:hypothetical protein
VSRKVIAYDQNIDTDVGRAAITVKISYKTFKIIETIHVSTEI